MRRLADWQAWQEFKAGTDLEGNRRGGLHGQHCRLLQRAAVERLCDRYPYLWIALGLSVAGYLTSVQDLKDAKRRAPKMRSYPTTQTDTRVSTKISTSSCQSSCRDDNGQAIDLPAENGDLHTRGGIPPYDTLHSRMPPPHRPWSKPTYVELSPADLDPDLLADWRELPANPA